MAEELNDQERRELERWRSGSLRKSWPVVESVPDGLRYAAELARAQGTEGGDEHDELLRQAAIRLRDMNDAARVLVADRELLLWLHAEAAWWLQLDRDEHESAEILHMWSKRVAYLEARVGELKNTIGELRAESENRLQVGDRLGWRLVEAQQETERLHSWSGLMELLDEHWPAEVFDGQSEDSDPGPRIAALIRAVDSERASRQAWAEEAMFSPRRREPRPSPAEVRPCSCLADGVTLPSGWSRPQCAVHPEGGTA